MASGERATLNPMSTEESPLVTRYYRTDAGFIQELHADLKSVIPLPEIGAELPLAEIYESGEFTAENEVPAG